MASAECSPAACILQRNQPHGQSLFLMGFGCQGGGRRRRPPPLPRTTAPDGCWQLGLRPLPQWHTPTVVTTGVPFPPLTPVPLSTGGVRIQGVRFRYDTFFGWCDWIRYRVIRVLEYGRVLNLNFFGGNSVDYVFWYVYFWYYVLAIGFYRLRELSVVNNLTGHIKTFCWSKSIEQEIVFWCCSFPLEKNV